MRIEQKACINCIVFPMCKSMFNDSLSPSLDLRATVLGFAFGIECSILQDYLFNSTQEMINEIRELYGLKPIKTGVIGRDDE